MADRLPFVLLRIFGNEQRPHDVLGGLPPTVFRETHLSRAKPRETAKTSTLELST
jgi:hypothetical protein